MELINEEKKEMLYVTMHATHLFVIIDQMWELAE